MAIGALKATWPNKVRNMSTGVKRNDQRLVNDNKAERERERDTLKKHGESKNGDSD